MAVRVAVEQQLAFGGKALAGQAKTHPGSKAR